ncbi:F0F1 ATP synthase subunit B [Paraglaciecola sp. L3A3]|uniref:F0F1 ATP synthase subunit B family protein n=1 Tax=Paraglaciecola sp. L3A3 TaxID=2686358 RepID=UPI00131CA33E|nr:F0F1 ATP synthase subunit B [Paraglaciecola sp. L3A3]
MLIDWFTVTAQAVNFLILVWLLKRFLYQPVLHAIDAREQRITAELADAAAKQIEAQTERDTFQLKNQNFEQQSDKLMQQAAAAASAEQTRLIEDVKKEAEVLRHKYQQSLANEVQHLKNSLSRKTSQEVFAITRKTLSEIATSSLEQQAIEVFIRRLRELNTSKKAILSEALQTCTLTSPAILRSAFQLSEIQIELIKKAINQTFSLQIPVKFLTQKEIISGIELTANGQKLVWSIDDYLSQLEQDVSALLNEKLQGQNKGSSADKEIADVKPTAKAKTPS